MSLRWFLIAVVALFAAYVVGRALGILLGIGPYATEIAAMGLVIAALAWTAARR
ncbi:MAG TPA: hypothetical protein VFX51_12155 [Solirubrobacteraceae bacterium]|nr:hypothetical protein [Solirubrobacteraceae bacterium]